MTARKEAEQKDVGATVQDLLDTAQLSWEAQVGASCGTTRCCFSDPFCLKLGDASTPSIPDYYGCSREPGSAAFSAALVTSIESVACLLLFVLSDLVGLQRRTGELRGSGTPALPERVPTGRIAVL